MTLRYVTRRVRRCQDWAEAGSDRLGRVNSAYLFLTLWSVTWHREFKASHWGRHTPRIHRMLQIKAVRLFQRLRSPSPHCGVATLTIFVTWTNRLINWIFFLSSLMRNHLGKKATHQRKTIPLAEFSRQAALK